MNGIKDFNVPEYMDIVHPERGFFGYLLRCKCLSNEELLPSHLVYRNNDNYYVIARSGDTFESLSRETGVSARNIRKYNELPKDYRLQTGDVLYLERKRKRASDAYKGRPHIVRAGESMYTIAQKYGIRLESLYEMNDLPDDYAVKVNDCLRIR